MAVLTPSLPLGVQEARRARHELGVGPTAPLHDALAVVESGFGVPVSVLPLPEGVAGAYARSEEKHFIFVNSNDAAVRRRFTLTHELGHHLLGHAGMVDREDDIFGRSGSPREKSANAFAAEFLLPTAGVSSWMEVNGVTAVDLEVVVRLAAYYRVSADTARYRLAAARFIPHTSDRDALAAAIVAGEHLKLQSKLQIKSPPDLIEAIDRGATRLPASLRRNAIRAYESGLIEIERVAEALHEQPDAIEAEFAVLGITREPDEPLY